MGGLSPAVLTDVLDAYRDYRLTVVIDYPDWMSHYRPYSFTPVGQIFHHDAFGENVSDDAVMQVMYYGRPDLPGPLPNDWIDSDSRIHMTSGGNANHAGRGEADVLLRVRNGMAPTGDAREDPDGDDPIGNPWFWGHECRNAGSGTDPWEQLDAMERAGAALCDVFGWSPNTCIGHKEWTARKPDPKGIVMPIFRSDVRRIQTEHNQPDPLPVLPKKLETLMELHLYYIRRAKPESGVPAGVPAERYSAIYTVTTKNRMWLVNPEEWKSDAAETTYMLTMLGIPNYKPPVLDWDERRVDSYKLCGPEAYPGDAKAGVQPDE